MRLINKKHLAGFTLNRQYEFSFSDKDKISHCPYFEVFDDCGEEWVFSKHKMLEYFSIIMKVK